MPDNSSPVPLPPAPPVPPLLSTVSDAPADEDLLSFAPYAQTLADIVADPTTETPLVIGVFGDWGSGKTSLMRMVERRIEERPADKKTAFPVQPLWFNAWMYSREEALWRAMLLHVLRGIRPLLTGNVAANRQLDRIASQLTMATETGGPVLTLPGEQVLLDRSGAQVNLPLLAGLRLLQASPGASDLDTLIAAVEEAQARSQQERIAALDDFRRTFEQINREHVEKRGRLVVFVDDLDRCLPERAVEALEAIKLFLDVPGCIFVLGVDRQVIERGIQVRYKDFDAGSFGPILLDGARYLEKIIQIPFSLPPAKAEAMRGFVERMTEGRLSDPRCAEVFARGLEPNPRRIKRTLNIFLLLERLAQNRPDLADRIKPVRLAKIVIIREYHPRLFALLTAGGHYLIDLEKRLREQLVAAREKELAPGEEHEVDAEYPVGGTSPGEAYGFGYGPGSGTGTGISAGPLQEFLGNSLLRGLLTWPALGEPDANFADLTPEGVSEYIFLTRSTVEDTAAQRQASKLAIEPQMVTIPAGSFLMGTPEEERDELLRLHKAEDDKFNAKLLDNEIGQYPIDLPTFEIGRYPVTNAEFARFMQAGGYDKRELWTEAGWQLKEQKIWTQPRYWTDDKLSKPDQPVVGVSWYEAVAYCKWLTAETGDAKRPYRLPTEPEWERAARGSTTGAGDNRRYPWGAQWDKQRCNNKELGLGQTTPVGQFSPAGDSPEGVSDLAGNVWEWCSTRYGGVEATVRFGYPYQADEREDLEGDDARILRGGSWFAGPAWCRCGYRLWYDPGGRFNSRGFRCARTVS